MELSIITWGTDSVPGIVHRFMSRLHEVMHVNVVKWPVVEQDRSQKLIVS
jgi:predicted oxidoreductase